MEINTNKEYEKEILREDNKYLWRHNVEKIVFVLLIHLNIIIKMNDVLGKSIAAI
jgi:hypothetical protein